MHDHTIRSLTLAGRPALGGFLLLASMATIPAAMPAAETDAVTPAQPSFADALMKGKVALNARYRYEFYDQESVPGSTTAANGLITDEARASTVRVALSYATQPFYGFNAFVEMEGVYAIGAHQDYRIPNTPDQGAKTQPVISDPLQTELNQAYVKYQGPAKVPLMFLAGREAYFLNNGRFISFSGWRQNTQSIELARGAYRFGDVTANYAFMNRVRRVVGTDATDGVLDMSSHVAHLDYKRDAMVSASLYAVLLDYDDQAQAANDTRSVGLRLNGPWKLDADWSVVYTADYARQRDYADNTRDVDLNYWTLELGPSYKGHRLFLGWSELEGDGIVSFRTPLAQPFNGWVEKFLNTPITGLDARYATLTGPVPSVTGLTYTLTGYDYHATEGDAHYGRELDAALEWKAEPILKNLTLGWRFGDYIADELFTDSLRTSVYTALSL